MKTLMMYLLAAFCLLANSASAEGYLPVIPEPASTVFTEGFFSFSPKNIRIYSKRDYKESEFLRSGLEELTGSRVKRAHKEQEATISLRLDSSASTAEGYRIEVLQDRIVVSGNDNAGLFYGIQTLLQLVRSGITGDIVSIRRCTVTDAPRFSWRAFMLDEARYFKGEKVVYKLLDEMAALKMNVFHWHLTDDQGWRIDIKKYPLLTKVGAKRKDTQVGGWNSKELAGVPHEGYYTQKQIKRIVAYAKARHIKIVPEIEMPGHASAAVAAYPWLGSSGEKIDVPATFGKHYAVFNVVDPKVKEFIEDVLTEVMDLFDSDVIHIGGDEVRFNQWEANEQVKKYKEDKGFTSFMDVQIDFTNQISHFLENKGRRMMGWNEILGKNLHADDKISFSDASQKIAPNVIVHFWKGDLKELTKAAQDGYTIVNSYHAMTYLDYGKGISLEKAYGFDPVPSGLPSEFAKNIIGSGCQMWSEWIPTVADMQEKVFPKIAAYAEVGWSLPEVKNFSNFVERLKPFTEKWKHEGVKIME